jgi:hypothetical protein
MASSFPSDVIKCRACGARDVQATSGIRADGLVTCCSCGTILWTWPEFQHRIEAVADASVAESGRLTTNLRPRARERGLRAL